MATLNTPVRIKIRKTPKVPNLRGQTPGFVVGQDYSRKNDIHRNYGGSEQGGISPSSFCKAIFLFTGKAGSEFGYADSFGPSGTFHFCGEGQTGPMKFIAGNKAIRDHAKDGRELHLFETLGKEQKRRYLGQFVLVNHTITQGRDKTGAMRDIIVFNLSPGGFPMHGLPIAPTGMPPAPQPATRPTLTEMRNAAVAANQAAKNAALPPAPPQIQQLRSDAVKTYILARAGCTCECCGNSAPFVRSDGSPYLESHHIERLSDGGVDHPKNMAGICPTCHCKIHYGINGSEVNSELAIKIKANW